MASPLSSRFHRRLKHGFPEHVASLLHRFLTHSVQRRTKPRASRHLRRACLMKSEIETPVSWANGKRRPVGPLVHQHPFDGPVSVALIRMTRPRFVSRRSLSGLFADPLRSYTCRFGD